MKKIIVSHKGNETCAAVLIDNELETFYNSSVDNPRLVGNIYKGRVQNFLPGMRASFIDIGRDKNVFLQTNSPQKFSAGQSVLIQIEKDASGLKGARATLNVSLPGRTLIFLPTLNYVGVSNKIQGNERERLHALAKKIRPKGAGLIVRTAAEGCDENILLKDLNELQKIWEKISERYSKRKPPALLYSDNDLIEKIIRDEFTADVEIVVDNLKIYRRFTELAPDAKIILHEDSAQIFESFDLTKEISNLNKRELTLPGGGQIVFDKTEALTAVDVNTGKFIGRTDFDETILKTNLEAAELILKQLKLRDIGGIIIVDFIDMEIDAHKKILMNFLREKAQLDRNKTKIVDMTPLGLVEITRHSSRR
ncbi:MAG: Rne/Rng family ribonuclease [Selenomonadaceae bacterium]|nr:Rne/Rng family ribonuclease [Selenomonadaceae bacterium]